jgi:hypothetical protein
MGSAQYNWASPIQYINIILLYNIIYKNKKITQKNKKNILFYTYIQVSQNKKSYRIFIQQKFKNIC